MLTPLPNKSISGDIKEFEDFFDRGASTCLKPKNNNVSIHVCQLLFLSQEEKIKSQGGSIFFLQKEPESKMLKKFNSTQNNLEKLVITINDNKETFNAHKELSHQVFAIKGHNQLINQNQRSRQRQDG